MKKAVYLFVLLIFAACGNKSNSNSSNSEDDKTDYAELEQKGYKDGYAYGSDDASDGKPYKTSFNINNAYDLWGTKKQSQTWVRGYTRGYDDGYNNGKAALQEGSSSGIDYQKETVTYSESSNKYSSTPNLNSSSIHSNERIYGEFYNYKETNDCEEGVVVYEGRGGYYIVETSKGYTVLEDYSGTLYEDAMVRGELNDYNYKYIINRNGNKEIKVYIYDYMLSDIKALDWLGKHDKLKNNDQETYNANND